MVVTISHNGYNQKHYGGYNVSGGRGRGGGINNFPSGNHNYVRKPDKKKQERGG